MCFVKVFRADVQGSEFRQRRGTAKAAVLNIFDFIVRDQVLRYPADGQRKRLLHQALWLKLVAISQAAHKGSFSVSVNPHLTALAFGSSEILTF